MVNHSLYLFLLILCGIDKTWSCLQLEKGRVVDILWSQLSTRFLHGNWQVCCISGTCDGINKFQTIFLKGGLALDPINLSQKVVKECTRSFFRFALTIRVFQIHDTYNNDFIISNNEYVQVSQYIDREM